jgi:hypothetical protein
VAYDESEIEQINGIEDLDCPEPQDVSAISNVPRLVWPIQKLKRQVEQVLVTVNAIETRRQNGVKKKLDTMRQRFTACVM